MNGLRDAVKVLDKYNLVNTTHGVLAARVYVAYHQKEYHVVFAIILAVNFHPHFHARLQYLWNESIYRVSELDCGRFKTSMAILIFVRI